MKIDYMLGTWSPLHLSLTGTNDIYYNYMSNLNTKIDNMVNTSQPSHLNLSRIQDTVDSLFHSLDILELSKAHTADARQ